MVNGLYTMIIILFVAFPAVQITGQRQPDAIPGEDTFSILFWNVENLFYPGDDTLKSDDAFTPEGERRWTWHRYWNKISAISLLIRSCNGWDLPWIIGFCEIENRDVLSDIAGHRILRPVAYGIVHREGPDHRGMDVGLVYRTDRLKLISHAFYPYVIQQTDTLPTREILVGEFAAFRDTLLIMLTHWTSRYGGVRETSAKRMAQAKFLREIVDSIENENPGKAILIMGDFNASEADPSLQHLLERPGQVKMIHLGKSKSYKYQGKWEQIDHIFIAGDTPLEPDSYAAVVLDFLLEEDRKYTGMKPNRTFAGYRYNGGISDHLPVMLKARLPVAASDSQH